MEKTPLATGNPSIPKFDEGELKGKIKDRLKKLLEGDSNKEACP